MWYFEWSSQKLGPGIKNSLNLALILETLTSTRFRAFKASALKTLPIRSPYILDRHSEMCTYITEAEIG